MLVNSKLLFYSLFSAFVLALLRKKIEVPWRKLLSFKKKAHVPEKYGVTLLGVYYETSYTVSGLETRYETTHVVRTGRRLRMLYDYSPQTFEVIKALAFQHAVS